ncbi:putative mitochondrial protein [Cucumis melo var. makuwa]|uniref:Putative mitochondrial protein n=1 Tax=Cucumis melo var. makuwa TaxID=1194695 RepID=A0A5D3DU30_CUCMM|nr:putative mitochondrial protein [Cucumis melo var. makuwa]
MIVDETQIETDETAAVAMEKLLHQLQKPPVIAMGPPSKSATLPSGWKEPHAPHLSPTRRRPSSLQFNRPTPNRGPLSSRSTLLVSRTSMHRRCPCFTRYPLSRPLQYDPLQQSHFHGTGIDQLHNKSRFEVGKSSTRSKPTDLPMYSKNPVAPFPTLSSNYITSFQAPSIDVFVGEKLNDHKYFPGLKRTVRVAMSVLTIPATDSTAFSARCSTHDSEKNNVKLIPICEHYKKKWHTKDQCWKLYGRPLGDQSQSTLHSKSHYAVSKITRELNCKATFLPDSVSFRDLSSRRTIGTAQHRRILYLLDDDTSQYSLPPLGNDGLWPLLMIILVLPGSSLALINPRDCSPKLVWLHPLTKWGCQAKKPSSSGSSNSLMLSTSLPSYLWGDDVLTAAYLINRMSSRVLHLQTPLDCFKESMIGPEDMEEKDSVDETEIRAETGGNETEKVYYLCQVPRGTVRGHSNHTLFTKVSKAGKMAVLIVYVDDVVLSKDDTVEIIQLKKKMVGMSGVVLLIILLNSTINWEIQSMQAPFEEHMEAVNRILRYLKTTPSKGLMFWKTNRRAIKAYTGSDWAESGANVLTKGFLKQSFDPCVRKLGLIFIYIPTERGSKVALFLDEKRSHKKSFCHGSGKYLLG